MSPLDAAQSPQSDLENSLPQSLEHNTAVFLQNENQPVPPSSLEQQHEYDPLSSAAPQAELPSALDEAPSEATVPPKRFRFTPIMLIPAFVFLLIIFGVGALAMRYLSPTPVAIMSSPTPIASPKVTPSPSPEPSQEPWNPPVADNLANATPGAYLASPKPTAIPTASGSPKPSGSPSVSPSPAGPVANLYFHKVGCVVMNPSQGSSTEEQMNISGKTYTKDGAPTTIQCNLIFQNSESTETGNITFDVLYDGRTIKRENVGTLKKGNHPVSEFKDYGVTITDPNKDTGEHTVQVRINPDKTFAESTFGDNTYTAKYTITQ